MVALWEILSATRGRSALDGIYDMFIYVIASIHAVMHYVWVDVVPMTIDLRCQSLVCFFFFFYIRMTFHAFISIFMPRMH